METNTVKKTAKRDPKIDTALASLTSVAAQIRYLHSIKMSTGDISRYLTDYYPDKPVRYQWVRNVLLQPLKKQG